MPIQNGSRGAATFLIQALTGSMVVAFHKILALAATTSHRVPYDFSIV
jgi:hypothetical protein